MISLSQTGFRENDAKFPPAYFPQKWEQFSLSHKFKILLFLCINIPLIKLCFQRRDFKTEIGLRVEKIVGKRYTGYFHGIFFTATLC